MSLLVDLFPGVEPKEEPNFIISEKEQFKTYRDKDGDGYLDIGEVGKKYIYNSFSICLLYHLSGGFRI